MKFAWLWHRFALRHAVAYHPAITPDYTLGGGKIRVFQQSSFEVPVEHRTCSCGEMWER